MSRFILLQCFAAFLTVGMTLTSAIAAERSDVPAQLKWKTTDLYPTDDAWRAQYDQLAKRVAEVAGYRGRLGESAATFAAALQLRSELDVALTRLYVYASMKSDEDTRDSKYQEMNTLAENLYSDYATAASFMRPEILSLGADKVRGFLAAEPKLAPYQFGLEDLLRYGPHTLSAAEEAVAARAGRLGGAGGSIRGVFANAEMKWPKVKLSDGTEVTLDAAAYTQYRQLPKREDRDVVFRAFFGAHKEWQNTYGAALDANVQAHLFNRDVHKYGSCLEAALFGDNIPTSVYHQLVKDVNANLPTLHRYLKLRQRMMGLPDLRYEDLYPSVVESVDLRYTPDEAQALVLDAVSPLGKDYVKVLGEGFRNGWVDWLPTPGKRSGAYSTGVYGVHPFQLQNFTGMYDEVSTVAHESGHSMHTYLADQAQPYPTHDYATFVAEVASTLNENLLFHRMLEKTKDPKTRLFLLSTHLEGMRTTMFRQSLFAEFELAIHEKAERGEALSGRAMSALYLDLVRKYYGHALGVCKVDELYGVEWAYIPHFFRNFYVYQYATSIIASSAIANGIYEDMAKGPNKPMPHRDAYLRMLASGGSKYPIDLLKGAGVDMTTSAPFLAAMAEMNRTMDEMEKILAALPKH
ncbi:MAG: oligoendopeptidase F [Candidatus Eisenbacteria bacterium]